VELSVLRNLCGSEASYEPELFPGMVYRPSHTHVVFLIFSSGRTVITGAKTIAEINREYCRLRERLAAFPPSIVADSVKAGRACKTRDRALTMLMSNPSVVRGTVPLDITSVRLDAT